MTIKSFWTIILKIAGLWFVFVGLTTLAPLISLLFFTSQNGHSPGIEKILEFFGIVTVIAGIFILLIWLLLFKPGWVIGKLRLDRGFAEERLELIMDRSAMLTIATIVVGGVVFLDSLPLLIKQTLSFFQKGNPIKDSQETIWIIYYLVKTIFGYLLLTNSRFVVNFIDGQNAKMRNGETNDPSFEE